LKKTCDAQARDLAAGNVRLAYRIAKDVYKRSGYSDLDELNGEALLALTLAAVRFDPSRKLQFSTFAYTSIYGMLRNRTERFLGFSSEAQVAAVKGARIASAARLAGDAHLTEADIEALVPGYTAALMLKRMADTASLDELANPEGSRVQVADTGTNVEDEALASQLDPILEAAIAGLGSMQERLVRRHVVDGESVESLAKSFGLSTQYLYEQKKRALQKLRSTLSLDRVTGEVRVAERAARTTTLARPRLRRVAA